MQGMIRESLQSTTVKDHHAHITAQSAGTHRQSATQISSHMKRYQRKKRCKHSVTRKYTGVPTHTK